MPSKSDSDAGPDAEPSPQPSPIKSLPPELLSRITHLTLEPTAGTKHSPENTTTLRSLALVSRAWYHSAVRELVASPRITSPTQLDVFGNLVERLGIGSCVKEVLISVGDLPRRKRVEALDQDGLVGVDRDALEKQYSDEWSNAIRTRYYLEDMYAISMSRIVHLCPRIAALRLSGMIGPGTVLKFVWSLPLDSVWINNSFLCSEPFDHLPSILRALHLTDVPTIISPYLLLSRLPCPSLLHLTCRQVVFELLPTPRSTRNGSIFDTITSLVLDTDVVTISALDTEYFPELIHLELVDAERPPVSYTRLQSTIALDQLHRLPKLRVLVLPDVENWRSAWEQKMLDQGEGSGSGEELKVVWKAVA